MAYFRPCCHGWTIFWGAVVLKRPIEDADGIVEVHSVDSQPLIQVLSWGQANSLFDVALPKGGIYVSLEC